MVSIDFLGHARGIGIAFGRNTYSYESGAMAETAHSLGRLKAERNKDTHDQSNKERPRQVHR